MHENTRKPFGAYLGAFMAAILLAATGMLASSAPALADDDVEYYVSLSGVPYGGDYGIYAKPGEKLAMKASVGYFDMETWNTVNVKGATFKWSFNNKLKATVSGNKATIKKLPKTGSYKFTVKAYDKDGTLLTTQKHTITVKKTPGAKIQIRNYKTDKVISSVKKGQEVAVSLNNASFGWDNNKKKNFYTWIVKKGSTTATWNPKTGNFKSNKIVGGASIAGGANPVFMGAFKQKGTYKVTAVIYHSDKKIQTVTKTIKVK